MRQGKCGIKPYLHRKNRIIYIHTDIHIIIYIGENKLYIIKTKKLKFMTKIETEKFVEHLLNIAVAHRMDETAENGKLSPTMKVFDYTANGKQKSMYIDWRSQEQMRRGVFSYSKDFVTDVKKQYEMIVIVNTEDHTDCLRWFPSQINSDTRFTKSYLENDAEPIYTVNFNNPNYGKRYEKENE